MSYTRFITIQELIERKVISGQNIILAHQHFGNNGLEVNYDNIRILLHIAFLASLGELLYNESDKEEYLQEVENRNHGIHESTQLFINLCNKGKISLVDKIVQQAKR